MVGRRFDVIFYSPFTYEFSLDFTELHNGAVRWLVSTRLAASSLRSWARSSRISKF